MAVPYFKEQTVCDTTFEKAKDDAQNCDYLCFEKLDPVKEKAISFKYSYVRYGEPHYSEEHFIPIETATESFIWVRGRPNDSLKGNCIKEGSLYGYEHFPKHLKKPILGLLVESPTQHTWSSRKFLGLIMLGLNLLLLVGWKYMSNQNQSLE